MATRKSEQHTQNRAVATKVSRPQKAKKNTFVVCTNISNAISNAFNYVDMPYQVDIVVLILAQKKLKVSDKDLFGKLSADELIQAKILNAAFTAKSTLTRGTKQRNTASLLLPSPQHPLQKLVTSGETIIIQQASRRPGDFAHDIGSHEQQSGRSEINNILDAQIHPF